jgi:hypothetical protein
VVTRWKVILAAVVIFFAGASTGALIVRNFAPKIVRRTHVSPPVPLSSTRRQEYLSKLDHELSLTPEQRQAAEVILSASQERMKQIWEPVEPKIKEEYRRTRREIADLLNPEQREKMKRWHTERDQRRRGSGDTNSISSRSRTNGFGPKGRRRNHRTEEPSDSSQRKPPGE